MWFTDGIGWKSARGNLRETFEVMEYVYSTENMENGVMERLFFYKINISKGFMKIAFNNRN